MERKLSEFILGCEHEMINEKVIIAPCWLPESVGIENPLLISENSCKIWNCEIDGIHITYIVTGVGAAVCMDIVKSLGNTCCKEILFIGSAGSLKQGQHIGDFAIPTGIIVAEGASRYLEDNISDDLFGKIVFISCNTRKKLYDCLKKITPKYGIHVHEGLGISVESISMQYEHMDQITSLKCDFIDMEASACLSAANSNEIECSVVFCISDNNSQGEALYTILDDRTKYRKQIRKTVMPFLIKEFIYE